MSQSPEERGPTIEADAGGRGRRHMSGRVAGILAVTVVTVVALAAWLSWDALHGIANRSAQINHAWVEPDGSLTVTYWYGAADTLLGTRVTETSDRVTVDVRMRTQTRGVFPAIAYNGQETFVLDQPLGDRQVVDGQRQQVQVTAGEPQ